MKLKIFLPLLLSGAAAFAGQSIQYGPQNLYNLNVPTTPTNRVEFYLHDWQSYSYTHLIVTPGGSHGAGATGWLTYMLTAGTSGIGIAAYNAWDNGAGAFIPLGELSVNAVYVRLQHDPMNMVDLYEAWDINGNRVFYTSVPFTSETDSGTAVMMGYGNEPGVSIGFMRIQTSLVPANSRPPVTYDPTNRLLEWKFDNSLADSSGNGYNVTYSGGNPTYVQTPYQNPVAILKSAANSWTNVVSQRAGYPVTLDGTSSFSQADSSASVSWFWQELSGPSQAIFSSRTSSMPTLSGVVFGDYLMQLTVTDAGSNEAVTTADVGAVAMDSKGVVVNADPNVDAIFGNMIAFGKNPWGYADYWEQHAMQLRAADYQYGTITGSGTWDNLQWEKTGSGTVSYYWYGTGIEPGTLTLGTSVSNGITATSTSINVADASRLDLTTFPTHIALAAYNYPPMVEDVRICSATGNTLNVCYDGRGPNAQAWNSGALVGQYKVTGAGTHFISDSQAPVCPVGPGPTGQAVFTAGSVTLTAGSTIMTGTDTGWTSTIGQTKSIANYYVRVPATHGGSSFVFIAQNTTGGAAATASVSGGIIRTVSPLYSLTGQNYLAGQVQVVIADPTGVGATVTANVVGGAITSYTVVNGGAGYTSPTILIELQAITLSRPYPAGADTGTYSGYAIMPGSRTLVLRGHHVFDPNGTGEWMWNASECESETELYLNPWTNGNEFAAGHDVPALDGNLQSGFQYSVTDSTGWINETSTAGINFYGESLASRALYYRSGLTAALNAANILDNYMVKSPWGNRDGSGFPELFVGGLAIGAYASAVLSNGVSWGDLRSYSGYGEDVANSVNNGGSPNCDIDDTRDTGYAYAWLILGAIYDPDTSVGGFRSRWIKDLSTMQANDAVCKRSDNSWSNGFYWNSVGNSSTGPVTLTANSTAVTGTNLPSYNCTGVTTGTGTVTNGSATINVYTGSIPVSGADGLVITGTSGGQPFTASFLFTGSTGSSATMSVLWPGDTGNVTWMAVNTSDGNGIDMTAFATSVSDYSDLANNYACMYISPTLLTLDHPWRGATGSNYYGWSSNLAGYGQQPFMLGIKSYGMGVLAAATAAPLATLASIYQGYNNGAATWIKNFGVDAPTLTTNYGRIFQFCEPDALASSPQFDWRSPGCNYSSSSANSMSVGREQDMEISNSTSDYYIYNPSSANKTWGDELYGAVWGNAAYNTGGVYYDAASDATNTNPTNLPDGAIHAGKWYGFFAGMGMLHRWPAVRLGGVDPPNYKTIDVPFTLTGVPGAAQVKLTVTEPSGKSEVSVCGVSPCAITLDARPGSPLMKIDYLNPSGAILSPGDTIPLYVPK